jgi:hypothetical protein
MATSPDVIGLRSIAFTIADIALGSIVKRCLEFPIERPAYPEAHPLAGGNRRAPRVRGGGRKQAQRAEPGGMMATE